MPKEYFRAYHRYLDYMRKLSDAECGRLFRALLTYSAGDMPINLKGREEVVFDIIRQDIDGENARCEQNRTNVSARYDATTTYEGLRTSTNGYERLRTATTSCEEEEREKEKVTQKEKDKEEEVKKEYPNGYSKESKHKHGEYGNVLLTDDEFEKLKQRFPDSFEQKISNLDEGIELKGYKYKSHYLAILNWARRDDERKKESGSGNPFLDMLRG